MLTLLGNALTFSMYERWASISDMPNCFMKPSANERGGVLTNTGVTSITASPFVSRPTMLKVMSTVCSEVASTLREMPGARALAISYLTPTTFTLAPRRMKRMTRESTSVPGEMLSEPPEIPANSVLSSISRPYMLSGIWSSRWSHTT